MAWRRIAILTLVASFCTGGTFTCRSDDDDDDDRVIVVTGKKSKRANKQSESGRSQVSKRPHRSVSR